MKNYKEDTIVAVATALGGGVAIIRISGHKSLEIGKAIWEGKSQISHSNAYRFLHGFVKNKEGKRCDEALVVFMPSPKSFTGEDVLEIHCHGGQVSTKVILRAICSLGARLAEAGEFTKRAFLNGKIDLTQAEAINDLIKAKTEKASFSAFNQLQGNLKKKIEGFYRELSEILSEIEVRMDFVDEDLDWMSLEEINSIIVNIIAEIKKMIKNKHFGRIFREGLKVVIAGQANVGKSSLLNHFLGFDRAIVTNIEGTTRDPLEEQVNIRGIPLKLVDTAGIRSTTNQIENMGVQKSKILLQEADIILWLVDASKDFNEQLPTPNSFPSNIPVLLIVNKIDLSDSRIINPSYPIAYISILKNKGIDVLYDKVESIALNNQQIDNNDVLINERHSLSFEKACEFLAPLENNIEDDQWELVAVNLRGTLEHLGVILGKTSLPDVLHSIFSKYCIGK